MWDTSIAPINEVDKINIPVLVIHGDVDQRVPVDHAKKYVTSARSLDKPVRYMELKAPTILVAPSSITTN